MTSRARTALLVVVVIVTVVSVAYLTNLAIVPDSADGYERTTPAVADDETDETLTTVNARTADTRAKRFTSLSDAESPAKNEGMWSVHDSSDIYAYVMCDMGFPPGIVFVTEDGTITRVHHAELDPEGASESDPTRHRGTGKYVLELPYGCTNGAGTDAGDQVEVE